jgi:hypothetical protein
VSSTDRAFRIVVYRLPRRQLITLHVYTAGAGDAIAAVSLDQRRARQLASFLLSDDAGKRPDGATGPRP